ncbi:hypothetical protein KQX54_003010 [Cotesia glomerata]|uniref:Uncharacterized protein n=1 Tax=Cotesia glomerata TaxID=32391 RepID=A0AAV7HWW3_COTGL|nr:hypothetical protein KQX54_003010 [Cotesia glomerata]
MPQIAGTYPNVSNVLADTSQNNFVQHHQQQQQQQQQQQPQQHQIHQGQFPRQQNNPYNQPVQVSPFERGFAMNQQGTYPANTPYQEPYSFNAVQFPLPPLASPQNYAYPNQAGMNPIVPNISPIYNSSPPQGQGFDPRSYIPTQPSPIFILPSNPVVQLPTQSPPNCPNTRSGVCGSQYCCSPAAPPPYIPFPCPLPYPAPFCRPLNCYDPISSPFCKESSFPTCACCPKRSDLPCEHRCEPTSEAICNKPNCPASISLQALASQLLSIPGVISCAATRLILRRVPGSNIRNSTEETVERARKTINTLTQEQLLTETRNAQQINALINIHMAANPPANIIPLLTTVQLKVNVLKSLLETIINHRITENQAAGAETCLGLDPIILGLKSDQELRTILATLRQKECDQRVNYNFASYHSQRVIAETRLKNIEDKIALVEAEIERRRCACLPPTLRQTGMTCQDSRGTVWHAYPGTLPPSSFGNFNYSGRQPSQDSPDPFCFDKTSPRRLNVPHVGSPETTYRKPPTMVKDKEDKRFSDDDCGCDKSTSYDKNDGKNAGSSNDCEDEDEEDDEEDDGQCTCDKLTDDEDKKKLRINPSEAGPSGGTEIQGKNVGFEGVGGEKVNLIDETEDNCGKIEETLDSSAQLKTSSSCNNNNNKSNDKIKIARQELQDKLLLQLSSAVGSCDPSNKNNHEKKEELTLTSDGSKYSNPFSQDPSESGFENEGMGLDKFISGALSVISGFSNHVASFGTIIGDKITALRSHLAPEISHPLFPRFSANSPSTCSNNHHNYDTPHYSGRENSNTLAQINNNNYDNNYPDKLSRTNCLFGKLKSSKIRRLNFDGRKTQGGEFFIEFNSNEKLSGLYKEEKTLLIRSRLKNSQSTIQLTPFIPFTVVKPPECRHENTPTLEITQKLVMKKVKLPNVGCDNNRLKTSRKFRSLSRVEKSREIIKVFGNKNGDENQTNINYENEGTLPENSRSFGSESWKSSENCWSSESTAGENSVNKIELFEFNSVENQMEVSSESIVGVHDYGL